MSQYITDLEVSLNETEDSQLSAQGFSKIPVDLNKGADGKNIYLWFKKGTSEPITRIQYSFVDEMRRSLGRAKYQKIPKNLYTGPLGKFIYLWFFKGSSVYDVPIVDLRVSTEDDAQKFRSGQERLALDLKWAGGSWVYLWVKREKPTYICDITAVADFQGDDDLFTNGYIRVDDDTNRRGGGPYIFIWYRQTTKPEGAIKDLQVSIIDGESQGFQSYQLVKTNLNQGTRGDPVFLWYKKDDGSSPIRGVTLVVGEKALAPFEAAGCEVIKKNLNAGNNGATELFLCFNR